MMTNKQNAQNKVPKNYIQGSDYVADSQYLLNDFKDILTYSLTSTITIGDNSIDKDTNWNYLEDNTVYGITSLEGQKAPSNDKFKDPTGVVLNFKTDYTNYQIALNNNALGFRIGTGDWGYLKTAQDVNINNYALKEDLNSLKELTNGLKNSLSGYSTRDETNKQINTLNDSLQEIDSKYSQLLETVNTNISSIQNSVNNLYTNEEIDEKIQKSQDYILDLNTPKPSSNPEADSIANPNQWFYEV